MYAIGILYVSQRGLRLMERGPGTAVGPPNLSAVCRRFLDLIKVTMCSSCTIIIIRISAGSVIARLIAGEERRSLRLA